MDMWRGGHVPPAHGLSGPSAASVSRIRTLNRHPGRRPQLVRAVEDPDSLTDSHPPLPASRLLNVPHRGFEAPLALPFAVQPEGQAFRRGKALEEVRLSDHLDRVACRQ